MRAARSLMFQGTGSDVGKSFLVAGLCRAFLRRGIRVAPFKPQNMSNNAAAVEGKGSEGEIGRAQWLQARAAGVQPTVHMNPVLLKPQSDRSSQIIVQGKVYGTSDARFFGSKRESLLDLVLESFHEVSRSVDLVLVEGAGSPSEVNLRQGDIANMGFARATDTPVILIGDIDRGGVIASLVGTRAVLEKEDAEMIRAFIINRFRGEESLFSEGLQFIAERTGWRPLGIVPWLAEAARLPAEDAVVLEKSVRQADRQRLTVAAPMLSRIANFDDLDPLRAEPGVEVVFVPPGQPIPPSDLIVLLGTKSTQADLAFLRSQGWDIDVHAHVRQGKRLLGLCGGFQMLGSAIRDPLGIEGDTPNLPGLGLLEMETVMEPDKQVHNIEGRSALGGARVEGYEIHTGRSRGPALEKPMLFLGGRPHGAISPDGRIMGCYLHGLFSNDAFRAEFLQQLGGESKCPDYWGGVETALDQVANQFEESLDLDGLLDIAGLKV